MTRRNVALLTLAVLVATVCVRLGVWQLQRLGERREHNASVHAGLERPTVPLDSLRGTPSERRYRPVSVSGRYDTAHELTLANRSRRGSPGVHIVTPLLRAGSDTAVLVLRGWIYSPDATHAELGSWREDSAAGAVGYVQTFDQEIAGQPGLLRRGILYRFTHRDAGAALPYPIAPYFVVLTDTTGAAPGAPPRLDRPELSEGNHLSYAFQWFAFAAVALAGTAVFLRQSARPGVSRDARFTPR